MEVLPAGRQLCSQHTQNETTRPSSEVLVLSGRIYRSSEREVQGLDLTSRTSPGEEE